MLQAFIQPITTSSILDWTSAPEHIWHGSSVTYIVHPSSRQSPSFLLALRIAFSSAWESVFLSEFFRKLREKKKQEKAALKAAKENPEGDPE